MKTRKEQLIEMTQTIVMALGEKALNTNASAIVCQARLLMSQIDLALNEDVVELKPGMTAAHGMVKGYPF